MFEVTHSLEQRFREIYDRSLDATDKQLHPRADDILFVTHMFKTLSLWKTTNPVYWSFIDTVLLNIETDQWVSAPSQWRMYLQNAMRKPISPYQVKVREDNFMSILNRMLQEHNLPQNDVGWTHLVLRWVRNPNGYRHMLQAASLLIDIHNLNVKKEEKA